MSALKIARNYVTFGTMTVVSVNSGPVDDTAPRPFVTVPDDDREPPDTSAAREPERDGEYEVRDDTAEFEKSETAVYLKLPIPPVFIRMWRWFDKIAGVQYR